MFRSNLAASAFASGGLISQSQSYSTSHKHPPQSILQQHADFGGRHQSSSQAIASAPLQLHKSEK